MTQQLAASDWHLPEQLSDSAEQKGIIRYIDATNGVGIIESLNYHEYLPFFIESIEIEKGWADGISENDCVEFEISNLTPPQLGLLESCTKNFKEYRDNISLHQCATNLKRLSEGSVIIEDILWDQPRYYGVIECELDAPKPNASNEYRSTTIEPTKGLIRLIDPYESSTVEAPKSRYLKLSSRTNSLITSKNLPIEDSVINKDKTEREKKESENKFSNKLLNAGLTLPFSGRDLLTTRIYLEKGDLVEFDVYRNKRNGSYGATNIVFLDPNPDNREWGIIAEWIHEPSYGLIKRIKHNLENEFIFFHQTEILDRDLEPNLGSQVEFISRYSKIREREYAARITYLPDNTIENTIIQEKIYEGEVITNISYGEEYGYDTKFPTIQYDNNKIIEVDENDSSQYLIKGDKVSFRIAETKYDPMQKLKATHVIVTKEVDKREHGEICRLVENKSCGFISCKGHPLNLFFTLDDWIDDPKNVPIYEGLKVDFCIIINKKQRQMAVRVRPLEKPLTEEEYDQTEQILKERSENEQNEKLKSIKKSTTEILSQNTQQNKYKRKTNINNQEGEMVNVNKLSQEFNIGEENQLQQPTGTGKTLILKNSLPPNSSLKRPMQVNNDMPEKKENKKDKSKGKITELESTKPPRQQRLEKEQQKMQQVLEQYDADKELELKVFESETFKKYKKDKHNTDNYNNYEGEYTSHTTFRHPSRKKHTTIDSPSYENYDEGNNEYNYDNYMSNNMSSRPVYQKKDKNTEYNRQTISSFRGDRSSDGKSSTFNSPRLSKKDITSVPNANPIFLRENQVLYQGTIIEPSNEYNSGIIEYEIENDNTKHQIQYKNKHIARWQKIEFFKGDEVNLVFNYYENDENNELLYIVLTLPCYFHCYRGSVISYDHEKGRGTILCDELKGSFITFFKSEIIDKHLQSALNFPDYVFYFDLFTKTDKSNNEKYYAQRLLNVYHHSKNTYYGIIKKTNKRFSNDDSPCGEIELISNNNNTDDNINQNYKLVKFRASGVDKNCLGKLQVNDKIVCNLDVIQIFGRTNKEIAFAININKENQ